MATAVKAASAGMTGAVRSLQWTIQDMNGSVEHLGQSHDHLRRAQNMMAWTTAIFGALLLSGLVWIANDIFHLKDQLVDSDRRFDTMDAQMTALGTRMDDLNLAIEQLGAQLIAARGNQAPANGPDVSVLSSPVTPQNFQTAAAAPLEAQIPDAAAQPQIFQAQPAAPVQQQAALAPVQQQAALAPLQQQAPAAAAPALAVIPPSPPAPRDQLTPEELAAPAPVLAAVAPAAAPAAPAAQAAPAAPAAETTETAAAPAPAPAAVASSAPAAGANLSDDQLLSFNDDQIDPADELLLLDENGNPQ